ncbi:MAG TPA: FtsQ-type POTRA domain-containing protein [Chthonomonadaceae bacterium]|nr:FtsQ-type POTRA domain-containing protein [Chthonomonadaceae bacterium]
MFRRRPTAPSDSRAPETGDAPRRGHAARQPCAPPPLDTGSRAERRRIRAPHRPSVVRRVRRKVLIALYTALAVEVFAAALFAPALHVRRVRVEGLQGLEPAEAAQVLNAVQIAPKTNWLRAPVGRIAQRLRALPWVRAADVRRRLPGTVVAAIALRQPVLLAQSGADWMEVDEAGVPIRRARPGEAARLPSLVLDRPLPIRPGVPLRDEAVKAAMRAYGAFRKGAGIHIAKIEVDQSGNICLNMQDGVAVQFGNTEELAPKIALLQRIYAREPDIAQRLIAIDISCPTWPACTPRSVLTSPARPQQPATPDTGKNAAPAVSPVSATTLSDTTRPEPPATNPFGGMKPAQKKPSH